jgi:hypothetical protein
VTPISLTSQILDISDLERFTPWQIILSTLTSLYVIRNFDKILGFGGESPLSQCAPAASLDPSLFQLQNL